MLQADDESDMMEVQMKSPFGSSFRTFNATDYKPIGKTFFFLLTHFSWSEKFLSDQIILWKYFLCVKCMLLI